jgi:hypothetical protein
MNVERPLLLAAIGRFGEAADIVGLQRGTVRASGSMMRSVDLRIMASKSEWT